MSRAPYVAPRIESRREIRSPLIGNAIASGSLESAAFRRSTPAYEAPRIQERTPIVGALMPFIGSGTPPP
jgi:hypothetical protein